MTVDYRYHEPYPRPGLQLADVRINSAMSTDRDYVVIGRSNRWNDGWGIFAIAHEHSGASDTIEHHFGMPIRREDIVRLRDACDQLLADHPLPDLSWRTAPASVPVQPEFEPVDALPGDCPSIHRNVLATALLANPQLRETIARVNGGLFGDWANNGLIPDIAPSKLATLSVDAWRAWRSARVAAAQ